MKGGRWERGRHQRRISKPPNILKYLDVLALTLPSIYRDLGGEGAVRG